MRERLQYLNTESVEPEAQRVSSPKEPLYSRTFTELEQTALAISRENGTQSIEEIKVAYNAWTRSFKALMASAVRNGKIRAEHVEVDGSLKKDLNILELGITRTEYLENNRYLADRIAGYKFGKSSKVRKAAASLAQTKSPEAIERQVSENEQKTQVTKKTGVYLWNKLGLPRLNS